MDNTIISQQTTLYAVDYITKLFSNAAQRIVKPFVWLRNLVIFKRYQLKTPHSPPHM